MLLLIDDFFIEFLFPHILISLVLFAEMISNVKVLDVVTGEHKLMILLSKHSSQYVVFYNFNSNN